MQVHVITKTRKELPKDACLIVPIFEDGDWALGAMIRKEDAAVVRKLWEQKRFSAKSEKSFFLPTPSAPYAGVLLLGLGKHVDFNAETMRRAAGAACETLSARRVSHAVLDSTVKEALPVEAFVEGIMLGQYDFPAYKKKPEEPLVKVENITIVVDSREAVAPVRQGCERAVLTCRNTNWARDLGNTAPNDLTPAALAAHADAMAREVGCECVIFDVDEMRKLGMHALLGVARGSSKAPKLIMLRYTHDDAEKNLAMVGKGITFDTGGISIKPSENMHEMKYDMCGAAAVLGAMKTICQLKPKINVVCVVPSAENKTGSDAQRPGDIVRAYSGKTIEVLNTDAEGRLILADALAFAVDTYKPDAIVDLATLTGAVVVTFGHYIAGVMSNNEDLMAQLRLAADASGERIWPLPLDKDYQRLIESKHADLANIGPPREAGSIIGGCFLKEFVGNTPWAHIDIAGTAWGAKHISYQDPGHASGYGVRLMTQWILDEAGME